MTEVKKSVKILLLSEFISDRGETELELEVLRSGILNSIDNRYEIALDLNDKLIDTQDTADRFVIVTSDKEIEQVPEACARILLRPRRIYSKQDNIDRLYIFLPEDTMSTMTTVRHFDRVYIRMQQNTGKIERYILTRQRLMRYQSLDDITIDFFEFGDRAELSYAVEEDKYMAKDEELRVANLLNRVINSAFEDSYFLKSQNIRL